MVRFSLLQQFDGLNNSKSVGSSVAFKSFENCSCQSVSVTCAGPNSLFITSAFSARSPVLRKET